MNKLRQDANIGVNIKKLRNKNNFTQDQVAAKLQILGSATTRSVYSRYETGELNIKVTDLIYLKEIFKCSFDDFFVELFI